MSETTTDVAAAAAAAAVQADADAAAAAAAQTDQGATTAAEGTPSAEETAAAEAAAAEAAKKPTRQERHVANLTRKAAEEARAREAAERRAEAAEALLAAAKGESGETPQATRTAEPDREALRAEIRFNDRLAEIDATGKKELGADAWETAKATLTGLGAVKNQAFLQALAETENPAKIFANLADDTDALLELLGKPPAAMAARLGRMDAGFAKPAVKPLSAAPKPAAKVDSGSNPPAINIYDPKLSMAEFNREMDKLLPPHLGGKRRTA